MTLVCTHEFTDRVMMLASTASYDKEGRVRKIDTGNNIQGVPGLPMALAAAGEGYLDSYFHDILRGRADTVDETIRRISKGLRDAEASGQSFGVWRLFIGAWSESRGPCHFVAMTKSPGIGIPAFRLLHMGPFHINGTTADWAALSIDPYHATPENYREFATEFAELNRSVPGPSENYPGRSLRMVGGQLRLATVTREGVEIETLTTWPDVPGEPISVYRGVAA